MGRNLKMIQEKVTAKKGLAEKIAFVLLKVQRKWATGMQKMTIGLSIRKLKVYVVIITLTMTGYTTFLVYSSLTDSHIRLPRMGSIQKPLMPKFDQEYTNNKDTLMLIRLKKFHKYMDSLDVSESGKKLRDSLLRQRPGLLDSLNQLEELLK
ncbi:hypothetical protein [Pedobacter panaciterrae]